MKTHEFAHKPAEEVFNQPPPLDDYNLLENDLPLREALRREGAAWAEGLVFLYGALLGKPENIHLGVQANRCLPELHTHDASGNRIDEVEYHPAYHALMRLGVEHALHAMPWKHPQRGAHAARGALMMLRHQLDEGTSCPLTMTFAVIPSLRLQSELAAEWEQRVLSTEYDPRFIPAPNKNGVLFGMAMTERQGGSDVQGNTTRAVPLGREGPGEEYTLTGHKWFCSAPMCDALPGAGAHRKRADLLPAAALDAGWKAQCLSHPAPQRQARQPLQRLRRGRVPRGVGAAGG
jgi:putative acyl-CoA dehydrogenase